MSGRQQRNHALPFMKYEAEGFSDSGNYPQGIKRGPNYYYKHGEYKAQSSHFQENERAEMRDGQGDIAMRHAPYGNPWSGRAVKLQNEDKIHVTVWRDRKPAERETGKKRRHRIHMNWFRITIPNGVRYEKIWLINLLQSHCSVPFTSVDFHYTKSEIRFFVQDASSASALSKISYEIRDKENRKICIFVSQSRAPYSVRNMLAPDTLAQLEVTVNKRYDDSLQALDLRRFRFDPDLLDREIDILLNRRSCMTATLKIIEKNFPGLVSLNLCDNRLYQLDGLSDIVQMVPTIKILNLTKNMLKTIWEVSKMKGLVLEELWLSGNPLCATFSDHSTYVSAVRACFPTLSRLDGEALPPAVVVKTETPNVIKPNGEMFYKGSEKMRSLVLQFLQQYYCIYDYGDRQGLLGAYHAQACFSLTVPFNPEKPAPSHLWHYLKDSRNMINLKDPNLRYQLLRATSHDIVSTLCMLPQTLHDFSSFLVNLWVHTETMLCFSVYGLFKEGSSPGFLRAFNRNFIAIPNSSSSSLCIVNDELFIRDAFLNSTQDVFSTPVYTATSNPVPLFPQQQCGMALSTPSGTSLQ